MSNYQNIVCHFGTRRQRRLIKKLQDLTPTSGMNYLYFHYCLQPSKGEKSKKKEKRRRNKGEGERGKENDRQTETGRIRTKKKKEIKISQIVAPFTTKENIPNAVI